MLTVPEEILGADWPRQKKSQDVLVRFLDVTSGAGENEVVAAVVSALAFARRHVIERDPLRTYTTTTVSTNGPVPTEQPLPGVGVGIPARRQRGMLMYRSRGTLRTLARTTRFSTGAQRWIGLDDRRIVTQKDRFFQRHRETEVKISSW